jgi:hypothetical protein
MLPSGWLVPIPIAIPNLIWALSPKGPAPEPSATPRRSRPTPLAFVEGVGRVAVLALPCFLEMQIHTGLDRVLVTVGVLALGVYYAGWARYFLRGRSPALLFAPLGILPVPLAVSPVIYFFAFAGLARSPLMALVTGLFGVAHISLSLKRTGRA